MAKHDTKCSSSDHNCHHTFFFLLPTYMKINAIYEQSRTSLTAFNTLCPHLSHKIEIRLGQFLLPEELALKVAAQKIILPRHFSSSSSDSEASKPNSRRNRSVKLSWVCSRTLSASVAVESHFTSVSSFFWLPLDVGEPNTVAVPTVTTQVYS